MTIDTTTAIEAAETRPNPLVLAAQLRELITLHDQLAPHINHKPATIQAERVDKSDGTEHPAPGHWTAVAIRADIHLTARAWAAMLNIERGLTPATGTTHGYLELIATYPGYFTNHPYANIARHVAETTEILVNRAHAALDPDTDTHHTPIGPCFDTTCNGKLTITWNPTEGTDDQRAWRLGQSRPLARCTSNRTHQIDAMLYAAGQHG